MNLKDLPYRKEQRAFEARYAASQNMPFTERPKRPRPGKAIRKAMKRARRDARRMSS